MSLLILSSLIYPTRPARSPSHRCPRRCRTGQSRLRAVARQTNHRRRSGRSPQCPVYGNALRRSVEPSHQHALSLSGRSRSPQEGSTRRVHATSPRHPQCNHADQDTMAMRVKGGVESIRSPAGMHRGGSRSKPPKAVAHRASLEAPRRMSDHQKAKRRLTSNTVAFSALFTLWLSTIQAVGLASRSACSRHFI